MTQDNRGQYGHPHKDLPEFAQVFSAIDRAVQDFRVCAEQIHFQVIYEREKPGGWRTPIIGLEKYQNELRTEPWLQAIDAEALQAATQRFRQVASQQQPRPAQPSARPESPQPRNPWSSGPGGPG